MARAMACVALLALIGASAVAAGSDRRATFLDATLEDPEGPDIAAVVVTSRPVAGWLTFRIRIPNRPTLTKDMRVALWIDSDLDRRTGLGDSTALPGADYFLNWDPKLRQDAGLLRCTASRCTTVLTRTLRFSYSSGATFTLHLADLGEPRRLRFAVRAYSGVEGTPETGLDFSNMRVDFAPTQGRAWIYLLPRA
jgi:hypothetical protein